MSEPAFDNDALLQAVRDLPVDSLTASRREAANSFVERGFPTVRDEDWKYTDLSNVIEISQQSLLVASAPATVDEDLLRQTQANLDAHWIVIANGKVLEQHSPGVNIPGVQSGALQQADLAIDEPLADLNLALLRDGLKLDISAEFVSDKPLGLLFIDTVESAVASTHTRVNLTVERNANARIIEAHVSSGPALHYSNCVLHLALAEGAVCEYLRLQDRAANHSQTARLNVSLERDSSLHHGSFDLGGKLTRNDLNVAVQGRNATAKFNGLYIVADGQHVDNHTKVDHLVGPAISQQEYRGVLSGHSRAVWNGKAIVHKGADGTDATQANHNLLLSDAAEIDAKPELEIYADDVKCAHGTTVGQLDERALFYLRARSISKSDAKRILTRAFAAIIVNTSPISEAHEFLGGHVEERLRTIDDGRQS